MKKYFLTIIVWILWSTSVFAYTPTATDEAIVQMIHPMLDELSLVEAAKISALLSHAKIKFEDDERKYRFADTLLSYLENGILQTPEIVQPLIYVEEGDTIWVFYKWTLEDGTLFDTNMQEVAEEYGTYNSARSYSPLEFTVWAWQMIPWFDAGVVGMALGLPKTLVIPPEDAYGFGNHFLAGETLVFEVTVEAIVE